MDTTFIPVTVVEPAGGDNETSVNRRRRFFSQMAVAVASALLGSEAAHAEESVVSHQDTGGAIPGTADQAATAPTPPPGQADTLVRMQAELKRSLLKPVRDRRWVMVIDMRKCTGCHSCTIGCVVENKLPPGVMYRPVLEEEIGTYPNVRRRFTPRPCMQCDEPACTPVCPVNATWKGEDGIVHVNYKDCIGCQSCLAACPYDARSFDSGEHYTDGTPNQELAAYDHAPNFEYGSKWTRENEESPIGNARKCHFCVHRLVEGMLPMCVTTCLGRATYFGDASDPDSVVADLIASPNAMRLKEEMGTQPRVYYLT